jgi:hypothetical protein
MRLDTAVTLAALLIALPASIFAQSDEHRGSSVKADGGRQSFTHGESKRCQSLTGPAKDQCDKEEANKGQAPAAESASAPAAAGGERFTHGESKRCEGLGAAAKDQCDREEATKTEGEQARDASK